MADVDKDAGTAGTMLLIAAVGRGISFGGIILVPFLCGGVVFAICRSILGLTSMYSFLAYVTATALIAYMGICQIVDRKRAESRR